MGSFSATLYMMFHLISRPISIKIKSGKSNAKSSGKKLLELKYDVPAPPLMYTREMLLGALSFPINVRFRT